jgi:hypothetical protein
MPTLGTRRRSGISGKDRVQPGLLLQHIGMPVGGIDSKFPMYPPLLYPYKSGMQ